MGIREHTRCSRSCTLPANYHDLFQCDCIAKLKPHEPRGFFYQRPLSRQLVLSEMRTGVGHDICSDYWVFILGLIMTQTRESVDKVWREAWSRLWALPAKNRVSPVHRPREQQTGSLWIVIYAVILPEKGFKLSLLRNGSLWSNALFRVTAALDHGILCARSTHYEMIRLRRGIDLAIDRGKAKRQRPCAHRRNTA